jgi:hypothetical protein
MQHRTTIVVSALALVLAFPPLSIVTSEPAQAQRRILGPLTSPFRMILRGMPRVRAPRAHRAPRATNRDVAGERSRSATRRQLARGGAAAGAAGAAVFWPTGAPDAFEDMIGYAFWPQEYGRQFWSHGPGDILRAMTAPSAAFVSQADASDDGAAGPRLTTGLVRTANAAESTREICIARVKDQAMRPLDRIDDTIRLTEEQRQGLETLRTAVRDAIESEAAACRGDLPATQPERLRALIDGLWAMRYAEFRIQPALATFYSSLTDEQKAQLAEAPQTVGSSEAAPSPAPAAICGEAVTSNANPFDPVQRALRPTDEQRKNLQMLYGASMEMAQFLTTTCPAETPSTPAARLSAASDRVMSLLHAAMNIEPILGQFYATLSDQQRRRFNAIR